MQFRMKADEETFFQVVADEAEKDFDPIELVYPSEVPYFDKYDELLPKELVRKGIGIPARKRIKKQQFKRFVLLKNLEAVF